jgi:hypothetical protein
LTEIHQWEIVFEDRYAGTAAPRDKRWSPRTLGSGRPDWFGWISEQLNSLKTAQFTVGKGSTKGQGQLCYTVSHTDPRAMFLYQLSGHRPFSVTDA